MKKLTAAIMASTIMLMNQNSAAAATPGTSADNPFFTEYTTTVLGTIPFSRVHNSDYEPAVDRGIKLQNQEIDAIVNNPDKPTFLNTIVARDAPAPTSTECSAHFTHCFLPTAMTNLWKYPCGCHQSSLTTPQVSHSIRDFGNASRAYTTTALR